MANDTDAGILRRIAGQADRGYEDRYLTAEDMAHLERIATRLDAPALPCEVYFAPGEFPNPFDKPCIMVSVTARYLGDRADEYQDIVLERVRAALLGSRPPDARQFVEGERVTLVARVKRPSANGTYVSVAIRTSVGNELTVAVPPETLEREIEL